MSSLKRRLDDLERAVKPKKKALIVIYDPEDTGELYQDGPKAYTRAELDQLEAAGVEVTIFEIVRGEDPES